MQLFLILVGLAVITAIIARRKGRSGFWWFVFGCFIPIISIPLALLVSDLNRQPCPHCGEKVMKIANICPHCHHELSHSGTVKQFTNLAADVWNAQRDAQAKLAVGDTLSLTAERKEGIQPRVRLDSKHGPVGHIRESNLYDVLVLLDRHAHEVRVVQSTPGTLKVTIRYLRGPADAPIQPEPAASAV
jgi:hypothetical protein